MTRSQPPASRASAASLGDVQVSIAAEVALSYITLRSAQARLGIANDNLASQQETLQITQWRQQAGLVTALEATGRFDALTAPELAAAIQGREDVILEEGLLASGRQALRFNTTGFRNTASGYLALESNTTGAGNTASGNQALVSNTTGIRNTASGYRSLYSNTTSNFFRAASSLQARSTAASRRMCPT